MKARMRIATAILIVGIITAGVGLAMADFNFYNLDVGGPYTHEEYAPGAVDLKSVHIEDDNRPIRILTSEDGDVRMKYAVREYESYEIALEGGELRVKFVDQTPWYKRVGINISQEDLGLTLYLPESFAGALYVSVHNGSVDINIPSAGDVTALTYNGSASISGVISNGALDIATSNGRLYLDRISFNSIIAESKNGSVSGVLAGSMDDYSISSHTANGSNNLPEEKAGGAKSLDARTYNGRIDITFEGD